MSTFVTTPHGARDCVVARVDSTRIRIAHVPDIAEALQVAREWGAGDFSFNAGRVVAFAFTTSTSEEESTCHA